MKPSFQISMELLQDKSALNSSVSGKPHMWETQVQFPFSNGSHLVALCELLYHIWTHLKGLWLQIWQSIVYFSDWNCFHKMNSRSATFNHEAHQVWFKPFPSGYDLPICILIFRGGKTLDNYSLKKVTCICKRHFIIVFCVNIIKVYSHPHSLASFFQLLYDRYNATLYLEAVGWP